MNFPPHLDLDCLEDGVNLFRFPLGDQLDSAVRKVPYEALDGEKSGQSLGGEPVPDTLDPARVQNAASFRRHERKLARPFL